MKLYVENFATFLLIGTLVLGGCAGCGDKEQEQAATPKLEAPVQVEIISSEGLEDVLETPTPVVEPPEPVIEVTRDQIPEAFPYPLTADNQHIWDKLVTDASQDPELMQTLLPDTKEAAIEMKNIMMKSPIRKYMISQFEEAAFNKLAKLYPNDPEVLFKHAFFFHVGNPNMSREQTLAGIAVWERVKKLNDEHNVPAHSRFRKTYGLSQAYIDVGEYEKALENVLEQREWLAAVRRAGHYGRGTKYGMSENNITLFHLNKKIREQREKQAVGQNR